MEAGDHVEHMRKMDEQHRPVAAKGQCAYCGHEWELEEEDERQMELNLPEGSQAPRR